MLIFRYIKPFYEKIEEYTWNKIKPIDAIVTIQSSNPEMEYNHLKRSISITKANTDSIKNTYMIEDFYPKSLKPISLEEYPGSYIECDLFSNLLKEYLNYIKENKKLFISSKIKMDDLIQTMIIIRNNKANIITHNKELKYILEQIVKTYKKYNILLIEENKNEI